MSEEIPYYGKTFAGKHFGYSIEARNIGTVPESFGNQIFDARWKRLNVETSIFRGKEEFPHLKILDLFSYQAAQAIRWWFLAELEKTCCSIFWETRIIKHEIEYKYAEKSVGVQDTLEWQKAHDILKS